MGVCVREGGKGERRNEHYLASIVDDQDEMDLSVPKHRRRLAWILSSGRFSSLTNEISLLPNGIYLVEKSN